MKAYVIKNKEGKYWQFLHNDISEFVDEIYNGFIHYSKHDAQKSIDLWELQDCKVVEITIAEGDLEKQLAEKDKEIDKWKKAFELSCNDRLIKVRHQVCEEIRKKLKKCLTPACGTYIVYYEAKNVEDALDQIEQGESK